MDDKKLSGEFILNNKEDDQPANDPQEIKSQHKTHAHKNPHFYSSYISYPNNITFVDQETNEEIILFIRRHFVTNVPWIVTALIFSVFPFTLLPIILRFFPFDPPSPQTVFLLILFYYLGIFGFILLKFTLWYFHVGIITNIRVRDIDIHGILYKDIAEAKNEFIQDVAHSQIGFIRSLFNYGEVVIQTAGTKPNIEFDKAPRPSEIARTIGELLGTK